MGDNLRIVTMGGDLAPLWLNYAQRRVDKTLENQWEAGKPVRALILKARRVGISTYIGGRFFAHLNANPNRFATITSADLVATNKIYGMVLLFQKHLPRKNRRPTESLSQRGLKYAEPHRSQILVQTAATDILGRGGLTHYLHISEAAFIRNAKTQLAGALQEIPDRPGTEIIWESTANGVGGTFHDRFVEAVQDWRLTESYDNYIPIFLPWFIFPDYQMVLPERYYFELGRAFNCPDEWVEDEQELAHRFNLSREQLYWRRWAIKNKCQSDLGLFHQEYPSTWREAFVASGRNVFLQSILDEWDKQAKSGRAVLFAKNSQLVDVNYRKNCWHVWKLPREGEEFCMGIDTQEGKQSDPDDPKSDYDWHGAVILNRDSGQIAAIYHGQGDQHELGEQCLWAAKFYNNAWIAPEVPSGMVVLDVLKQADYQYIYCQQRHDYQQTTEDMPDMGWRTTQITRPKMLEDLKNAVSNNEIHAYSAELINEMREFQYDKNGKPCHQPGGHDDLIFGAGIALQIHKRLPHRPKPYEHETTVDIVEDKSRPLRQLARAGVVDNWEPGDEDEDEGYLYTE